MKMKKFINAPETITDEELVGLGLAYPDILDVDGHLVISKDLADADRVTIVTYGGSGHEPAQAGFVGTGMLDVQAVGDIFAAPNGKLVFDSMKLADKGHGVLLLTLNYAGDSESELFDVAAAAAHEGSEASKQFVSKFGRAKSYGEQTIGTPDAGATSMAYFFKGLSKAN